MRMKTFAPLFLLLLLVSCETLFLEDPPILFHASTETASTPGTKVFADENLKVRWNADDRISLFDKSTYNYQYRFLGEDGETAGDFEKIATSGFITGNKLEHYYAAYPYSKANKMSNQGVLTMTFQAEQAWKEQSFGVGANLMVAVSDDDFLAFKNVGGYLSIRLYGDNISVSRITLRAVNGEKLAGPASIVIEPDQDPAVTMDPSATDAVSVVCSPAVPIGADAGACTDFWFVLPPVTLTGGFTITVEDGQGGTFTKSASSSYSVKRNQLDWMKALEVVY